jgi:hypothetical protein
MYMLMFVLDDLEHLDLVLEAWESIGVSGVTMVESTGIIRRRRAQQVGTTFMAGINRLMSGDQTTHQTLFAIVQNEEMVKKCREAVEDIVGDLNEPNTGVMAAWPLAYVKGVPEKD